MSNCLDVFIDVTVKALDLVIESPHCVVEVTLVTIVDVEASLVFSAHNKSNPHFANETTCGLHSGRHGSKYQS